MKPSRSATAPTGYERLLQDEASESCPDNRGRVWLRIRAICFVGLGISLAFVILIFAASTSLHILPGHSQCRHPALRQEWRMLSIEARQSYVAAVQCLSAIPSRLVLNMTRYDDFVYSHLGMFNTTHRVDLSLPWHRWYIQQYENALRNECGYKGYLAYWDWTLDASSPLTSPIWSNESGFGGNGSSPDNCLDYGPLARMAPQYPEPHCLRRNFAVDNMYGENYTAALVEDLISASKTYEEFRVGLEDGPHRWVHRGIGGEMPLPWSTNDPIFFVHHAQIDRLWWRWQNRVSMSYETYYTSTENPQQTGTLPGLLGVPRPLMRSQLKLYGLGEDKTVEDMISTETSLLCYRYPVT